MKKKMRRITAFLMLCVMISTISIPTYAQTADDSTDVKHETVRVAMLQYPNFIDYDTYGNPSGFSCDYLDEIARYTGWTYQYIPVSFTEAQKMLEEGTLDIVPGTQYTEERAERYDYCETSMVVDSNVLCVPVDNMDFYYNDFKALEGKSIGVMTGSIRKDQFSRILDEAGVSVNFVEFDTDAEEKAALKSGTVCAILMTMLRCTSDYRIIASANPTDVYFTCNPKNPSIKEKIDAAQQEILSENPYYGLQLAQKHYGSVPRAYAFSEEERKYMESCPPVTVAISTDMKPTEYYDSKTNTFRGLVVDYFEKISKITGIQFQYVARGDKKEIIHALEDGTVQIIATITEGANVERTYPLTLTDSYLQTSVSLAYNKNMTDALDTDSCIALKNGFLYYKDLAEKQGYTNFVYYDTFAECVDAVNKGEADVTYLPNFSVSSLTGHAYLQNVKVFSSEITNYQCAIGVANQCDSKLVSILDKALASIPESEKETMLLNAVSGNRDEKTFKDIYYENQTTILYLIILVSVLIGALGISLALHRNRTNRKLEEAMATVEQANAAKADFMSRMSHDMRTPMNGILGLTELSECESDVTVLTDNMKKIKQSGQYLLCLINDTLDFQKIETGRLKLEPQIVSTRELVTDVIQMIQIDAEKKGVDVQMLTEGANLDGLVRVDPVRMKQVFINLLSNAVKFTPSGGSVKICFKCTGHTGNIAHDIITVTDTGIGMSRDFIENHIFQPFSQEHSDIVANYSGSGLGLSIAKRLVEMMNGSIAVESELGKGTTFTVKIDFENVAESEVENVSRQTEMKHQQTEELLKKMHILLAEDQPMNAEIARRLLERVGCTVEWVSDGQKCLDCFEASEANQFDTILMDIRMPNMDGITAARMIRNLPRPDAAKIPIIAMTANAYDSDVKKCLEAGMNAHIAKPIEPQKMYETIAAQNQGCMHDDSMVLNQSEIFGQVKRWK
ncbi:MAG: transporter substrate-binding domain-containing protein [bacterium]|nr:transporter substrate-binding domain-containing protein [bacterium]